MIGQNVGMVLNLVNSGSGSEEDKLQVYIHKTINYLSTYMYNYALVSTSLALPLCLKSVTDCQIEKYSRNRI